MFHGSNVGAAGQIRTADLILTNIGLMFPGGPYSTQQILQKLGFSMGCGFSMSQPVPPSPSENHVPNAAII